MLNILPVLVSEDDVIETTDDVDMDTVIDDMEFSTEFIDLLSTYDGLSYGDVDINDIIREFIDDNLEYEYELNNSQLNELHDYLTGRLSDVLC